MTVITPIAGKVANTVLKSKKVSREVRASGGEE